MSPDGKYQSSIQRDGYNYYVGTVPAILLYFIIFLFDLFDYMLILKHQRIGRYQHTLSRNKQIRKTPQWC